MAICRLIVVGHGRSAAQHNLAMPRHSGQQWRAQTARGKQREMIRRWLVRARRLVLGTPWRRLGNLALTEHINRALYQIAIRQSLDVLSTKLHFIVPVVAQRLQFDN